MRSIITTLTGFLLVFMTVTAQGQTKDLRKGERLFKEFKYAEAIPYLRSAYKETSSPLALEYMAYSFLHTKDYESALSTFRILAFDKQADPKFWLEYGKLLMNHGFYDDARKWFIQYLRTNPSSMEIRMLLRSCDRAPELQGNPYGYGVESWVHNSEFHDFSPVRYQNSWVFTSNRFKDVGGQTFGWDNLPYLKLMQVSVDSSSNRPTTFSSRVNGKFHVGPAVFNKNYDEIFFTQNQLQGGKVQVDAKGVTRLEILWSKQTIAGWSKPERLSFNNPEFSVGHPALSPDGNTLYFTSDMPGGLGGTDIWMVTRVGERSWSAPKNLGPQINSPGDEMFPTVTDTLLYFSSDYFVGMGGLDIFFATKKDSGWVNRSNIGYPINSPRDDFGFTPIEDGNKGFVSSNRATGKGKDDIYYFKTIKICAAITVMDSLTYDMIPKAKVRVSNDFTFTEEFVTGPDGKVKLCLPSDNDFTITVERKDYLPKRYRFSSKGIVHDVDTLVLAEMIKGIPFSFRGKVISDETNKPVEGALVKINGPGFKDVIETKADGSFLPSLEPSSHYEMEVLKDGHLTYKEEFDTPKDSMMTKEVRIRPLGMGKKIDLQNIYYDLNSAEIRPDAARVLDSLVKIMKDNPYLRVELGSHTDSRASYQYNIKLSEQRAMNAIRYLTSRGIEGYRLTYKYYGETKLAKPCPDGVDCGEAQHQENRRTEFKIIAY